MLVKLFSQISKNDAATAGGKGASLGEMTQAGIPVPPGFVILSNAFERFLEETDLNVEIDTILHSVDHREMHTVENASEKIQALILGAKMPEDIAVTVRESYKELGAQYVAVRSSATAEDSASAAWAGQLDSFLNTTEETLLTNVQKCWASLFTPRAIFYRFEKELHKQKISVAVVVQKMVESECSGIAFSVHPVTEDHNQLIIEAGFGLGEAIVSGSITPDSYVVEKEPRRIIDTNINTQTRSLIRANSGMGNEWQNIPEPKASSQVLTEKQILELSELILRIENHYGFPCDIEWAFEDGKFYITQSRPITTLTQKNKDIFTTMVNMQSREHSLTYCHVWQIANQTQTRNLFESVKNILFVNNGAHKKTRVWYGQKELEDIFINTGARVKNEEDFFERVSKEFVSLTDELLPYCEGKKKIESLKEWKWFYNKWIEWWAPMAIIFVLPESKTAPESIREKALALRAQTEKYSDSGDRLVMEYLHKQYPQYKELVEFMTPEEILHIEELTDIQINEIKGRKNGYVFFNGTLYARNGLDSITAKYKLLLDEPRIQSSSEIKGSCASRGKVTGSVIVIYGKKDLARVTPNSVLVTEMTSPDYVPYLKKVAAIVTDEGGVNCHAAIVSREMDIPCIIGTKIATQVLHDSDLVEVDADNGIVKIMQRNSIDLGQLSSLSWSKRWEAPLPLYVIYMGVGGYFEPMRKEMGYSFTKVLIDSKEGVSGCYLLDTDQDEFAAILLEKVRQDPDVLIEWAKQFKDRGDKLTSLYSNEPSWFLKEENYRTFSDAMNAFGVYLVTVTQIVDRLDERLHKKYGLVLEEARKHTQSVFFDIESVVNGFFRIIAKEKDYSPEEISSCSVEEILEYVVNGRLPEKESLTARHARSALLFAPKPMPLSGEEASTLIQMMTENSYKGGTLHGQTAYKGVVKGKCRVIKNYKNEISFEDGRILVTGMTDPRFVPMMKKAAAIVTDAGGILSHAAIVSRELKIPCVIGTKVATQVLHDGDFVEVDADAGVVRIISPENPFGSIDQWQRLFRVQGLRFLIDDIWMEYYKTLGALTVIIDDEYTSYLPHKIIERTLADGTDLISNPESFEHYETEFRNYMKEVQSYTASLTFESASKEEVGHLLNEFARLFYYYSKTEFFSTDGAYKLFVETKDKGIEKRLKQMGQIKNDGRSFLNSIFFGADGVLPKLLKSLEQRFGVPERILQQYSREEILALFDGEQVPDTKIEQRNDAFYILGKDGTTIIKTGTEAREDIQAFVGESAREHSETITGTSAHLGKARGTARIIRAGYDNFDALHHLMDAMQEGDILIAETTSPELMPACQKAGGIITDQGGMLSHAAIVSRELNIPCVVGTSNATEVIKDGDLIEIDGDKGVAHVIERAQRG